MGRWAAQLLRRLESAVAWPLPGEAAVWDELAKWIAFRESDRDALRVLAGWDADDDRRYKVDPLAPLISSAYSSLIYGGVLQIAANSEGDQANADRLREANGSGFGGAHRVVSSEGDAYYRILADEDLADCPLVEWVSRTAVVPLFIAGRLKAVAFVSRLDPLVGDPSGVVRRHFEIHDDGDVLNVLFEGTVDRLGETVPLEDHPDTEDLDEGWNHGLPMLAGRIANREGVDPTRGVSDYHDIEDWLLELNDCIATGSENRLLTAKKRVIAPSSALDAWGRLPAGEEVLVSDSDAGQLGEDGKPVKFGTLEFEFDATALIEWQTQVATIACVRAGITPQFTGQPTNDAAGDGSLTSGTALRIRLTPSVNAGRERAEGWNRENPSIWTKLQLVDALPRDDGGFGRNWATPEMAPAIDRGSSLPEDPVERDSRLAAAVGGSVCSIRQAVVERHRDDGWNAKQVDAEVAAIKRDQRDSQPAGLGSLFGDNGDGGGGDAPPVDEPVDGPAAA